MSRPDQLQGTLELLILKTLVTGPNHGFGITLHVQEASGGLLNIEDGSLYPALHRLEKNGLVRGEWRKTVSGRRARFYAITKTGDKRLAEAAKNWTSVVKGVQRVMGLA